MKHLRTLPFWLLVLVLVVFSVSNRGAVTISIFPLPYEVTVPIYLVFFGGLFMGFLLAGFVALWRSAMVGAERRRARRERSELARKVDSLEDEAAAQPSAGDEGAGGSGSGDEGATGAVGAQRLLANKHSSS